MSAIPIHAANPTPLGSGRAPGAELGLRRLHLVGARADLGRGRVPRVARGRGPPRAPHAGARRRTIAQHARDDARRIRAGLGRQPARSGRELSRRVAAPGRDRPLVTGEPASGKPPPTSAQLAAPLRIRPPRRPAPNAIEAAGVRRSSARQALASSSGSSPPVRPSRWWSPMPASCGCRPSPSSPRGCRWHAGLGAQALPGGRPVARTVLSADGRSLRPATRSSSTDTGWTPGTRGARCTGSPRARARKGHPDHAGGHGDASVATFLAARRSVNG